MHSIQFINNKKSLFLEIAYNVKVKVKLIKVITYFYIITNLIRFIILWVPYYTTLRITIKFTNQK